MTLRKPLAVATLMAGLAISSLGHAQTAQQPDAADLKAISTYTLSDSFIGTWKKVLSASSKDVCHLDPMLAMRAYHDSPTLAALASKYDAQPGVHAMLTNAGTNAHDYLLGMTVLMTAALQEGLKEHPEAAAQIKNSGPQVNPANLAFVKTHEADMRAYSMQVAQQVKAANGGNMPNCAGAPGTT